MADTNQLSDREIEILQLVATGLTNREIAQSLTISPNTVKVHLRNIFEKIDVSSRTEATIYGIENGIVDVPGANGVNNQTEPANKSNKNYLSIFAVILSVILVIFAFNWDRIFPQSTPAPNIIENPPSRWQELAPLPESLSNMTAVAYDKEIFVISGENEESITGSVFRYNTDTDIWERSTDKPNPVKDIEGVVIGEKIYVPGGRTENGEPTDVLDIYDLRTGTWEFGNSLPVEISGYALAAYEGKIYLFGGWDGETVLDVVLIYDPLMDRWDYGTPMPTARAHAGAAVANGKIFVIGGWDGNRAVDTNESYTPSRDTINEIAWVMESAFPESGYVIGVESLADILFVLGDNGVWQYSARSGIWNFDENKLPIEFDSKVGFTSLEGYLFVIGGIDTENNQTRLFRYQAIYSLFIPIINTQ